MGDRIEQLPHEEPASVQSGKTSQWALTSDWLAHRATIKRLYLDEDKSLKEVKEIMEQEYGFRATDKMYKSRLKSWNLEKNLRRDEVLAMMRVKKHRDAIGKPAEFWRNGKMITHEMLTSYLKFNKSVAAEIQKYMVKDITSGDPIEALLPSHITVLSPMSPLELDQQLHNTEGMVVSLRDYMGASLSNGTWRIGDWGNWHSNKGGTFHVTLRFRAYFWVAMRMVNEGHKARAEYLNLAFAAVRPIILTENPNLVVEITTLYFELESTFKRPEIARIFIDYISRISHQCLGEKHPITNWFKGLYRLKDSKAATYELLIRSYQDLVRAQAKVHNQNVTHAILNYSKVADVLDPQFWTKEQEFLAKEIKDVVKVHSIYEQIACGLRRYRVMRLQDHGQYGEAERVAKEYLEYDPGDWPAFQYFFGHIHGAMGRTEESKRAFADDLGWGGRFETDKLEKEYDIARIRLQWRIIDGLEQWGHYEEAAKVRRIRDQVIENAMATLRVDDLFYDTFEKRGRF